MESKSQLKEFVEELENKIIIAQNIANDKQKESLFDERRESIFYQEGGKSSAYHTVLKMIDEMKKSWQGFD